jgi:hypothetical protein
MAFPRSNTHQDIYQNIVDVKINNKHENCNSSSLPTGPNVGHHTYYGNNTQELGKKDKFSIKDMQNTSFKRTNKKSTSGCIIL